MDWSGHHDGWGSHVDPHSGMYYAAGAYHPPTPQTAAHQAAAAAAGIAAASQQAAYAQHGGAAAVASATSGSTAGATNAGAAAVGASSAGVAGATGMTTGGAGAGGPAAGNTSSGAGGGGKGKGKGKKGKKGNSQSGGPTGGAINFDIPESEALPIDAFKKRIVRHFLRHRITCIQGDTGCGKSTRVPVYLKEMWDAGLMHNPRLLLKQESQGSAAGVSSWDEGTGPANDGPEEEYLDCHRLKVLVTQPRRIACISLAKRVASVLGEELGNSVGYQISGDTAVKKTTQIVFVTTGYLLQVVVNNPERLNEYSHIVLDEVHERDIDADLVNLVVKLQMQSASFRLVIMSATLQGDLFGKYFCEGRKRVNPIQVGAKRFDVDEVHLDELHSKYEFSPESTEAIRNGIWLFKDFRGGLGVAGAAAGHNGSVASEQQTALEKYLNAHNSDTEEENDAQAAHAQHQSQLRTKPQHPRGARGRMPHATITKDFELVVKEVITQSAKGGEGILVFLPGIGEITELHDQLLPLEQIGVGGGAGGGGKNNNQIRYRIFVLHSLIPKDEQECAVFSPPDANSCHVILASNIAESSLTIPNIRFVIDFGLRRQLVYDSRRHMSCLSTTWVSQASVKQRMGRTGRVFAGTNIRLYTRGFYEMLPEFDAPEMETAPLEKLYVNVKFLAAKLPPFPIPDDPSGASARKLKPRELLRLTAQPPDVSALERSVATLVEMGALTSNSEEAELSLLGHLMLTLPLDIYLCRLVVYGALFGCIGDAIVIASALSTQDPFTLPTHLVIKDQYEFANAIKRSYLSRKHFDAGQYSEPLMLRNLFVQWTQDFHLFKQRQCSHRRGYVQENHRASFTKFSQNFARHYAVVPKRCVHLCMNVLDTATRFKKFVNRDTVLHDDISKLMQLLSPYYHDDVKPVDLFNTPSHILKALLLASFSPNLLIGNTKIRDADNPKRKKAGENLNAKELVMQDMLLKGLDPRRSVQMVMEIPKEVESRETMKEDLQATFAQMMSCNPRDIIIYLDPDWKKLFIEFKTESQINTPEDVHPPRDDLAAAGGGAENDYYYGMPSARDHGIFPPLTGICKMETGKLDDIQTLPLGAQLIDMFGSGRFKFHAKLVEATFQFEDRYNENRQNQVIPLGDSVAGEGTAGGGTSGTSGAGGAGGAAGGTTGTTAADSASGTSGGAAGTGVVVGGGGGGGVQLNAASKDSQKAALQDSTAWVDEFYNEAPDFYGGGGGGANQGWDMDESQIYLNFFKPISPFEIVWDVYSNENMLTVDNFEELRAEEYSKACALQEGGKKAKKKDVVRLMETIQRKKIKPIKGNCTWRNVLGALTSCNLSKMEPELTDFLDESSQAAMRRPRWQLPQIQPPVPNEIIACYTSQQGASDQMNPAGSQNPGIQNVWLDGVTILSCNFYDKPVNESVSNSEPNELGDLPVSDQLPSLYATMLMLCFCPSNYAVNVSGSFDTGRISKIEIGSHAPLRCSTPDKSTHLHINDIERVNRLRRIISDAFLGWDTTQAKKGKDGDPHNENSKNSYERATESNDSEVVGLEVPSLIDSPAVRTALDDLLRDIGKGPSVCRDLPDEMEYQFRNLDIHNPKHYYDPGLYNADTQPSIFTGVTHGFEIPTKVKRPAKSRSKDGGGPLASPATASATGTIADSDLFQKLFVKPYHKNPQFSCPKLPVKQISYPNPDYYPAYAEWYGGYGPSIYSTQFLTYFSDPQNSLENFRLLKPAVSLEAIRDIRIKVIQEQRGVHYFATGGGNLHGAAARVGVNSGKGFLPAAAAGGAFQKGGPPAGGGVVSGLGAGGMGGMVGHNLVNIPATGPQSQKTKITSANPKYADSLRRQIAGFDMAMPGNQSGVVDHKNSMKLIGGGAPGPGPGGHLQHHHGGLMNPLKPLKPLPGNSQGLANHVLGQAANPHAALGGSMQNPLAQQVQNCIKPFQKKKDYVKGKLMEEIDVNNWDEVVEEDEEGSEDDEDEEEIVTGGEKRAARRKATEDGGEEDDDDESSDSDSSPGRAIVNAMKNLPNAVGGTAPHTASATGEAAVDAAAGADAGTAAAAQAKAGAACELHKSGASASAVLAGKKTGAGKGGVLAGKKGAPPQSQSSAGAKAAFNLQKGGFSGAGMGNVSSAAPLGADSVLNTTNEEDDSDEEVFLTHAPPNSKMSYSTRARPMGKAGLPPGISAVSGHFGTGKGHGRDGDHSYFSATSGMYPGGGGMAHHGTGNTSGKKGAKQNAWGREEGGKNKGSAQTGNSYDSSHSQSHAGGNNATGSGAWGSAWGSAGAGATDSSGYHDPWGTASSNWGQASGNKNSSKGSSPADQSWGNPAATASAAASASTGGGGKKGSSVDQWGQGGSQSTRPKGAAAAAYGGGSASWGTSMANAAWGAAGAGGAAASSSGQGYGKEATGPTTPRTKGFGKKGGSSFGGKKGSSAAAGHGQHHQHHQTAAAAAAAVQQQHHQAYLHGAHASVAAGGLAAGAGGAAAYGAAGHYVGVGAAGAASGVAAQTPAGATGYEEQEEDHDGCQGMAWGAAAAYAEDPWGAHAAAQAHHNAAYYNHAAAAAGAFHHPGSSTAAGSLVGSKLKPGSLGSKGGGYGYGAAAQHHAAAAAWGAELTATADHDASQVENYTATYDQHAGTTTTTAGQHEAAAVAQHHASAAPTSTASTTGEKKTSAGAASGGANGGAAAGTGAGAGAAGSASSTTAAGAAAAGTSAAASGSAAAAKKSSASSSSASVPEGWREAEDPKTGRKYYWNVATKQTQWKKPTGETTTTTGESASQSKQGSKLSANASEYIPSAEGSSSKEHQHYYSSQVHHTHTTGARGSLPPAALSAGSAGVITHSGAPHHHAATMTTAAAHGYHQHHHAAAAAGAAAGTTPPGAGAAEAMWAATAAHHQMWGPAVSHQPTLFYTTPTSVTYGGTPGATSYINTGYVESQI